LSSNIDIYVRKQSDRKTPSWIGSSNSKLKVTLAFSGSARPYYAANVYEVANGVGIVNFKEWGEVVTVCRAKHVKIGLAYRCILHGGIGSEELFFDVPQRELVAQEQTL
jgi:hypothetical protein